jgi:hypothetical protein
VRQAKGAAEEPVVVDHGVAVRVARRVWGDDEVAVTIHSPWPCSTSRATTPWTRTWICSCSGSGVARFSPSLRTQRCNPYAG